jgi:regulatory protein
MPYANKRPSPDREPPKKKQPKSAKSYMIWLLSRQEYSAAALKKKLMVKEFSDEEIDAALAFAQAHQFQSDERFAQTRAASKSSQHGNWRLKQGLMQKGISEELAKAQMENLPSEEERIIGLLNRFVGKELTPELRQKVYRFLAQRGFSSKPIKSAFQFLENGLKEAGAENTD